MARKLTQRKQSVSALQLFRDLGVSYNTTWRLKQKILQVMTARCDGERLAGRGALGQARRGTAGKVPFATAVETTADGRPLKAQFRRVSGFTRTALQGYAQADVAPASHGVSDGLDCFRVFDQLKYTHERIVSGVAGPVLKIRRLMRPQDAVGLPLLASTAPAADHSNSNAAPVEQFSSGGLPIGLTRFGAGCRKQRHVVDTTIFDQWTSLKILKNIVKVYLFHHYL